MITLISQSNCHHIPHKRFNMSINTHNASSSASGVAPSDVETEGTSGSDTIFWRADGSFISQSGRQSWINTDEDGEALLAPKPTLAEIADLVKSDVKFTDNTADTRFDSFHQPFVAAAEVFDTAFKELFVQGQLEYRLQNDLTVTRYVAENAVEEYITVDEEGTNGIKLVKVYEAYGGLIAPYVGAFKEEVPEEHKHIWMKKCLVYRNLIWCARHNMLEVVNKIAPDTLNLGTGLADERNLAVYWRYGNASGTNATPSLVSDGGSTMADSDSDSHDD
jgi:hypothetical protein